MSLLKKYFNEGNITDRWGTKVGHITHLDSDSAIVYDNSGKAIGRIEEYKGNLEFLNEKNMLAARGKTYGRDDMLEIYGLDGSRLSRFEENSGKSYQIDRYSYTPSTIYNSASCSSDDEEDGLGPEFWDNCYNDEDDEYDY